MTTPLRCLIAVSFLATSGCAGTISSVFHRPITAHDFEDNRLMTITGERRLAFIAPKTSDLRMCAESLPEVSSAVAAASGASAKFLDKGEGSLNEAFKTALLQTFTRAEIAEVLRQMGWQASQAWAQGAISNEQYQEELSRIIGAGIKVVELRATQPLGTIPAGGSLDPSSSSGAAPPAKPENKDQKKEEPKKEVKKEEPKKDSAPPKE